MQNLPHSLAALFSPSRVEEKPREADNLSLRLQYHKDRKQYHTDFTIPCCYLSGRRHPSDAIRARVLNPVMGVALKPNNKTAKGERILVWISRVSLFFLKLSTLSLKILLVTHPITDGN